ncbi:MAG: hypothetical protein SFU91_08240 [Chloroherpetonaceae bacterium]|nr:hypothetical protein [Chloroherpetonaceae bacterium]
MKKTLLALFTAFLMGCGEKLSLDEFPTNILTSQVPVFYSPVAPIWSGNTLSSISGIGGFNRPSDILVGYDETVYIVDAGNNRVVQTDLAGEVLGTSRFISRPKAAVQTRNMRLFVTAVIDTTINFGGFLGTRRVPVAAIFRLNLVSASGRISNATPELYYLHPVSRASDTLVRFNGITAVYDNTVYVARSGAVNNIGSFEQPDNAILLFPQNFNPQTDRPALIPGLTASGTGSGALDAISSLTSYAQPPQSPAVSRDLAFFFTSTSPTQNFKAQRVNYVVSSSGEGFVPDITFLTTPGKFRRPTDITFAGDETQFVFVLDSETDSLYQFDVRGVEGVVPRTAPSERYNVSFSRFGGGTDALRDPEGVAYYQRTLYIADTGNNRILRFRLTTDIR